MKNLLYILSILLICNVAAYAQYDQNFKTLGDQSFKNKNYYEAAYYYKKSAEQVSVTENKLRVPFGEIEKKSPVVAKLSEINTIYFQLAESYRLYENYLEAEPWYYKIINSDAQFPLARLWYGVCLRANQHFDEAIVQLSQFTKSYHGDSKNISIANEEIANCRFAKDQYQFPILVDVAKMQNDWNSDGSNYAVVNTGNTFMFTSSRLIKNDKKHLNRLYNMPAGNVQPQMVSFKNSDDKRDVEYGTPSIDPTGTKLYMTRWYKIGSKTIHSIYRSDSRDGDWGAPVKLNSNVNLGGFDAIQPFVTTDGKHLYFVSNKPGGQGGDDIWMSDLDTDGNPVNSINLGGTVNTPLDEEAPFYDNVNKRLVYSSKGFTGLGGFDLFESMGDMLHWDKPRNMGYPINSAKDDLYFYPDAADASKFFISSDRQSDCCLELFQATDKRFVLGGLVVDCDTHKALPGVKVSFIDSLSQETLKEEIVGADAQYTFRINNNRPYRLMLEKKGYFSKTIPVTIPGKIQQDTMFGADVCLQGFEVNKPVVIKNIFYDFGKADLRPESKTVLERLAIILKDNPKIKIELSAHTDSIGSDAYNNNLSQMRAQSCVDYIIGTGITADRIFAKGYGKTKPIAPNSMPDGKDNPDGRQLNRRTEFKVLKIN